MGMAAMMGRYVRKPRGWFEWIKLGATTVIWMLLIGFIGQWIYEYDSCRYAPDAAGPVSCLVMALFSTYLVWWLMAVIHFIKLMMAML
jgi:hypothetical protein